MQIKQRIEKVKEALRKAEEARIKAETEYETYQRQQKEIELQFLAEGVTPEEVGSEIESLKAEIEGAIARVEALIPCV